MSHAFQMCHMNYGEIQKTERNLFRLSATVKLRLLSGTNIDQKRNVGERKRWLERKVKIANIEACYKVCRNVEALYCMCSMISHIILFGKIFGLYSKCALFMIAKDEKRKRKREREQ